MVVSLSQIRNELTMEEPLDIQSIVKELKRERDRLDRAIAALDGTELPLEPQGPRPVAHVRGVPAKRGDRLTPEGRKRLSEALKKRWAERRKMAAGARKKVAGRR
jgi:hypothetical protein